MFTEEEKRFFQENCDGYLEWHKNKELLLGKKVEFDKAKNTIHNSDYATVLKKLIKDTGFFFEEQNLDFLISIIENLNTSYFA